MASSGTAPVAAPLVALRPPLELAARIGCAGIRDLDARSAGPATVLSTTPAGCTRGRARCAGSGRANQAAQLAVAPSAAGQLPSTGSAPGTAGRTARPSPRPRVPRLVALTDIVGDAPGLLDWPAAFPHPRRRVSRPRAARPATAEGPR
ncbi:MAG TPA: hypothetical protein VM367_10235 [Pseudonocardia sp.]|jgi:hypothetical protein|nr:hypothetical protein [Pseudonocardia sp.]